MKLPELSESASPEFTDAATCKAWLEHVPLANVAAAQSELLEQLEEYNSFPAAANQMFKVGEDSGTLSIHPGPQCNIEDPERIICDPSGAEFKMEGLTLPPDVPPLRLSGREQLLSQIDRHFTSLERSGSSLTSGSANSGITSHPRELGQARHVGIPRW